MRRFEAVAAALFGVAFIGLAIAVAIETVLRKVFVVSLQGVDELSGYVLAIGGALSFAVALVSRAHIRIDIVHDHLPALIRIVLNVLAVVTLLVCALALGRMAWIALSDSILFRATAQTPWATPLRIPQGAWLAALALFVAVAALQVVRVGMLVATGRFDRIDREYSPRGSKEELQEELDDIKARGADKLTIPGSGGRP